MNFSAVTPRPKSEATLAVVMIIIAKIMILHLIGRPVICDCGVLKLWEGTPSPAHNSQHFADHYSFLHAAFGIGLFHLLAGLRPDWSMARLAIAVTASSAIWEVAENTPFIIDRFASWSSNLDYGGDSLANSLGDTLFTLLGAAIAARLNWTLALFLVLAIEVAVYLLIGDGLVAGALRLLTGTSLA
ncbi:MULTISPECIES: DUF2585 family protein [unclassified Aminobacter]|uniref:DUF2585 family protein n=1 Tax=unclassified Aminobacter TaxID=2644704 RepID=UPI000466A725|nr:MULTISPECIES: DUF2585 family protein [unclassified Aminobacter]TWH33491.1 uncharacterized protein DUF2585 [Aminobacter sp. J15]